MKLWMTRQHVAKLLSAYSHGELPVQEQQRVHAHLEICDRCRHEYEEIQRGIELATQLRGVPAPETLRIETLWQSSAPTKKFVAVWMPAVAATAVLILTLGGWFMLRRSEPQNAAPAMGDKTLTAQSQNATESQLPKTTASLPVNERKLPDPNLTKSAGAETQHSKSRKNDPGAWAVENLAGTPRIGAAKISDTGKLAVGEWLETDNASRAKIKVAEIGYVDIDPNSRVRLLRTKDTEHRIALARGKMSALILAPPRLFFVETPSATAIDMGCAYTLEVDERGNSVLQVTSGWVSFVRNGQESFIPAGAVCATRKGKGVGTPYFADASDTFKTALTALDFGTVQVGRKALPTLLDEARSADAITLWHLLGRQYGAKTTELRGLIFDCLVKLAPPPTNVTRSGVILGNKRMLKIWWDEKIQ